MITITGGQLPISGGTLTGPLAIAVGSAAAPGLAVAGDANTGLFAPAADVLAVATAGVERLRVSSGGYVGIGVSPTEKLHVGSSTADVVLLVKATATTAYSASLVLDRGLDYRVAGIAFRSQGNNQWFAGSGYNGGSNEYGFMIGADQNISNARFYIANTGYVGIATTAATAALHLPASSTARASLRIPAGTAPTTPNTGDVWAAGGKLYFYDGATTKEIAFV